VARLIVAAYVGITMCERGMTFSCPARTWWRG